MIALCKCGVDMMEHDDIDHAFDASGTKHRCDNLVETEAGSCHICGAEGYAYFYCPRPAYHDEHNVECGPLTGEKLW